MLHLTGLGIASRAAKCLGADRSSSPAVNNRYSDLRLLWGSVSRCWRRLWTERAGDLANTEMETVLPLRNRAKLLWVARNARAVAFARESRIGRQIRRR